MTALFSEVHLEKVKEVGPEIEALYKYTERDFALTMVEIGQRRIGTLSDYRRIEEYGTKIGDADEGRKTTYSDDEIIDWNKPETVSGFHETFVNVVKGKNPDL